MEEENYGYADNSTEGSIEATQDSEFAAENSLHSAGDIVSGIGSAIYHAGGVVYHAAQADISLVTGDDAGFEQHIQEAEDSEQASADGLLPLVDTVKSWID
jgi:hypothetical protein